MGESQSATASDHALRASHTELAITPSINAMIVVAISSVQRDLASLISKSVTVRRIDALFDLGVQVVSFNTNVIRLH